MKKIWAVLLAISMLAGTFIVPIGADTVYAAEELQEGDYTYTVSDGVAIIIGYTGTEEEVVTPTTLGGYPVKYIGNNAFRKKNMKSVIVSEGIDQIGMGAFEECSSLERIYFSKTVRTIGLYALLFTENLESMTVEPGNQYYYSREGVLFKYMNDGIMLSDYPAAKETESYRVPNDVTEIAMTSFYCVKYLKNIYITQNVSYIAHRAFNRFKNPLNVYLLHDTAPVLNQQMFQKMPSGCHVIVKEQSVANAIDEEEIFYETPNSSIIVLGEDEAYPAIPTTSLTWDGTNTTGELTLKLGEKCRLNYVQEPLSATDNITWSVVEGQDQEPYFATVIFEDQTAGIVEGWNTGKCKVIGTSDNGMTITLDVIVTNPIEKFYFQDYKMTRNCGKYSEWVEMGDIGTHVTIPLGEKGWFNLNEFYSYYANTGGIGFVSSDPTIACITESDIYLGQYYVMVQALAPGTTTITATLDEGGKIWTDSFELTVTKSLEDCTAEISNAGELVYTGEAVIPELTVMDGEKELKEGTDYTVTAVDNISAGTMTVTVIGKGFYTGSRTLKAVIATPYIDFCSYTDREIERNRYYVPVDADGYALPEQLLVVVNGRKLVKGTDYTVAVQTRSTNAGTFADIAIAGIGNYTGTLRKSVTIRKGDEKRWNQGGGQNTTDPNGQKQNNSPNNGNNTSGGTNASGGQETQTKRPGKTAVTTAKSKKRGQLLVKWKKCKAADGYQLQYSTKKSFKKAKSVWIKKGKTTSTTIRKLKSKKTYSIRIRAYKTVKKGRKAGKLYGAWSSKKAVRIR